jgi:hypothetical protein
MKPPEIYLKGSHGDFDTIVMEVRICRNRKDGTIWSLNDFQSPSDKELPQQWKGGGIQAIGSALVTEALRRAAFAFLLSYLSQPANSNFLGNYRKSSKEIQDKNEKLLTSMLEDSLSLSVKRLSLPVVREILAMLIAQIPVQG